VTTAWIYAQILIGAVMRHTDAGLAIPDFPLAFGHLIPPHWDPKIAIHFAHRIGALVATALIVATAGHVVHHHRRTGDLVRPSVLLLLLLAAQVTLGAFTVLTARHYIINSLHVVTGASLLVTALVLALRAHRSRIGAQLHEAADSPSIAAVASRAGARA
jgi:cytochrome c oxidase assembly protein subunit 15